MANIYRQITVLTAYIIILHETIKSLPLKTIHAYIHVIEYTSLYPTMSIVTLMNVLVSYLLNTWYNDNCKEKSTSTCIYTHAY